MNSSTSAQTLTKLGDTDEDEMADTIATAIRAALEDC